MEDRRQPKKLVTPNGTVPPHQVKNIGFLKTAGYAFLKN
jgi:hypothetical protein